MTSVTRHRHPLKALGVVAVVLGVVLLNLGLTPGLATDEPDALAEADLVVWQGPTGIGVDAPGGEPGARSLQVGDRVVVRFVESDAGRWVVAAGAGVEIVPVDSAPRATTGHGAGEVVVLEFLAAGVHRVDVGVEVAGVTEVSTPLWFEVDARAGHDDDPAPPDGLVDDGADASTDAAAPAPADDEASDEGSATPVDDGVAADDPGTPVGDLPDQPRDDAPAPGDDVVSVGDDGEPALGDGPAPGADLAPESDGAGTGSEPSPGAPDGGETDPEGDGDPELAPRLAPLALSVASDGHPDVVGGRVDLRDVHIDIGARIIDGGLRQLVKDGTSPTAPVWRPLGDVVFHAGEASEIEVPDNPAFAFLGQAGAQSWVLPQVQRAGLLWPGWNTEAVDPGAIEGGVHWRLLGVDGPGTFAIFTTNAFGTPSVLFDSSDGLPDSYTIPLGTHAHGNWAFSAPGRYRLTFEMSATLTGGTSVSDRGVVTFQVHGTLDAPEDAPDDEPGDGSDDASDDEPGDGAGGGAGNGSGSGSGDDPGTTLPETGTDTAPLAAAGVICVAVGCGLLAASRRTRVLA